MSSSTLENRSVTLADIAREVGVTPITVHNALNGKGRVSPGMRERVLETAREMGYQSNLLARSLATGRAMALGVLAYRIESNLAARQLAAVENEAQKHGYHLVVAAHNHDPQRALEALREMTARRMDGVISISSTANMQPGVVEGLKTLQLPTVFSFHEPHGPRESDCVTIDQQQGARKAVDFLLRQGRNKIAFLSGPRGRLVTETRLEGFEMALRAAGFEPSTAPRAFAEDFSPRHGKSEAHQLLESKPDAIFCASDGLAASVLRAARDRWLRVPADLMVIGFDDSLLCEATDPTLTSVQMPIEEVGRECVRRLLFRLENPQDWSPQTQRLNCRLIRRESA